ncbi:hypothetical protein MtrunA17_Chr8g0384831 [Medicago truncatula]|uniref:Uncharacterized protein n=1 Tax=Medicago truncatula TaxID=3880 RepID=A0A396GPX0_MEDTR|nr:hypothetical protein MtrunA17_Chr8g0384831 [Medicago truncatula]
MQLQQPRKVEGANPKPPSPFPDQAKLISSSPLAASFASSKQTLLPKKVSGKKGEIGSVSQEF